jgi:hypothetical protein
MLGSQQQPEEGAPSPAKDAPGPPDRPKNDTQIEEFMRDQHRSKRVVGIEEPTQE